VGPGGLEEYSQRIAAIDRVDEIAPIKENEAYQRAYQKWKKELQNKLDKLN